MLETFSLLEYIRVYILGSVHSEASKVYMHVEDPVEVTGGVA